MSLYLGSPDGNAMLHITNSNTSSSDLKNNAILPNTTYSSKVNISEVSYYSVSGEEQVYLAIDLYSVNYTKVYSGPLVEGEILMIKIDNDIYRIVDKFFDTSYEPPEWTGSGPRIALYINDSGFHDAGNYIYTRVPNSSSVVVLLKMKLEEFIPKITKGIKLNSNGIFMGDVNISNKMFLTKEATALTHDFHIQLQSRTLTILNSSYLDAGRSALTVRGNSIGYSINGVDYTVFGNDSQGIAKTSSLRSTSHTIEYTTYDNGSAYLTIVRIPHAPQYNNTAVTSTTIHMDDFLKTIVYTTDGIPNNMYTRYGYPTIEIYIYSTSVEVYFYNTNQVYERSSTYVESIVTTL